MNHVFHKLANDAWIDVPEGQGYDGKIFNKEKFAELIVRECCEILRENVEVALNASGSPVYPEGLIKEHFGVEE
jgi:hypothetical protein